MTLRCKKSISLPTDGYQISVYTPNTIKSMTGTLGSSTGSLDLEPAKINRVHP